MKILLVATLALLVSFTYGQLSIEGNTGFQAPSFTSLGNGNWAKIDLAKIYHNVPEGMTQEDLLSLEAGKTASVTTLVKDEWSWGFVPGIDGFDHANTQWYILRDSSIVPTTTRLSLLVPIKDEWTLIFMVVYVFFFMIPFGIWREIRKKRKLAT